VGTADNFDRRRYVGWDASDFGDVSLCFSADDVIEEPAYDIGFPPFNVKRCFFYSTFWFKLNIFNDNLIILFPHWF